ncbi:MAG: hypothetical protein V1707_01795 [bacterium]
MKLTFQRQFQDNPRNILLHCGYHEFHPPHNPAAVSYVRVLARSGWYPRFHVYVEEQGNGLTINLHLDQKKESYAGVHAHSGDYDDSSPAVAEEAMRLTDCVNALP